MNGETGHMEQVCSLLLRDGDVCALNKGTGFTINQVLLCSLSCLSGQQVHVAKKKPSYWNNLVFPTKLLIPLPMH